MTANSKTAIWQRLALLGCALAFSTGPMQADSVPSVESEADVAAQLQKMGDGSAEIVPGFKKKRGLLLLKLARIYKGKGNLVVAESLYRNALTYLKASVGLYDSNVSQCLDELASTLTQEKLFDEARGVVRQQNVVAIALAGNPPPPDQSKDSYIDWLKNTSELGHPSSPTLLGLAYLKGDGVAVDLTKAREYFQKAVEQGDGCGEVNLALMYAEGKGVAKNQSKADELFSLAAGYGVFYPASGAYNNGTAQYQLGIAADTGNGLRKEVGNAYQWFSLAAKSGCPQADAAAKRLSALNQGLSPEDIDLYQQQLANWKDQQNIALSP